MLSGAFAGVDPLALSHDERMALLAGIEAECSRLAGLRARTLAAVEADDTTTKRWAREEAALAMRVAACTATTHVKEAEHLVSRLPATLAALESGALTAGHARALAEATWALEPAVTGKVEADCLEKVAAGYGATAGSFRQIVRRAVAAADPRAFEAKHADAVAQRRVSLRVQDHGVGDLYATALPADAIAAIKHELISRAAAARLLPDGTRDPRSADQRRADTLVDLLTRSAAHAHPVAGPADADSAAVAGASVAGAQVAGVLTGVGRSAPAVQVTVAASTLLGLDDQPGELDGHGPIPASLARTLAEDPSGTWRRILTDPAGRPLEVSKAYIPPPRLARHVIARDRHCRFPNCTRRAVTSEIDHVLDHDLGGPTSETNLHCLCPRHHHLKTEAPGWSVRRLDDGTTRWRTPSSRVIDVPPEPYDDTPNQWRQPVETDAEHEAELDRTAPIGGYYPDAPPPWEEPLDLDDRESEVA